MTARDPESSPLLEIRDLQLDLETGNERIRAVDRLSLKIHKNETVGLVGESGSGKSLTALSIARLVPSPPARYSGGRILLDGEDVLSAPPARLRAIRGRKVNYIFQEPGVSLNPVFRIGRQIKETLKLHRPGSATDDEVLRLLASVGIPAPATRMRNYPHQLSGGMQQRVMIAMALASHPSLLVADEPTTALDVTIQADILELLQALRESIGMSMLFITHNLALLKTIAHRVAVMYCGQIVETAPASALLASPRHPYTRALIASVPALGRSLPRLKSIDGLVPPPGRFPSGCRFHPRCPIARTECAQSDPPLTETKPNHWVRCPFT